MHHKHFYLISCFHDQCSQFSRICIIMSDSCKTAMEKYKDISNKNYAKLMGYLFKMKELEQIVLQKGFFTSIKGHLCLSNGTWIIQKDRRMLNPPKLQVIVDICHLSKFLLGKIFFIKKDEAFFSKAFDPWMLYLSKIWSVQEEVSVQDIVRIEKSNIFNFFENKGQYEELLSPQVLLVVL